MPVRPDLKARYDAEINQLQSTMAAGKDAAHINAALAAAQRAADVFAGSRDPDELEMRHLAFMDAASTLRNARMFPEAEAAFQRAAEVARSEIGGQSRAHWLSHYFVGLVRQQQGNEAGAADAFRTAFEGFSASPQWANEARLTGAALGLSLLRERRWNDVVEVLSRIANPAIVDESEASIHHNLALALVRSGAGAKALPPAQTASALRLQISGAAHPLTIETWLVEAQALADAGQSGASGALIRKAAGVILGGPGEAHPFFARALLAEARRVAQLGDGAAAEALARRANFILDQAGLAPNVRDDYDLEMREIPTFWRPGVQAKAPEDVRLWRIEFQHTLRRYQVATLDFALSDEVTKTWYFFVPASLQLTHPEVALRTVRMALADANAKLNAQEPADANFIDVTSATATLPGFEELAEADPMQFFPQRTWEVATDFNVTAAWRGRPMYPSEFALALHAYAALHGRPIDRAAWVAVGMEDAALKSAADAPADTLRQTLALP